LQKPIALGADLVVHSATKYLGGHSDLIAGIVVAADKELGDRIKFIQNASGGILSPHDSWLVIRGVETLYLRVKEHSASALKVAQFLEEHPAVESVYYPGLATHPNHKIAARQQSGGYGGVVSFTLRDNTEVAATKVVCATRLFTLAESLGGVRSLLCHPASMTHKSIPADKRRSAGVADSLVRLSVGLEDASDLIQDIGQALDQLLYNRKTNSLSSQVSVATWLS
jgi:cystathionine beta-lyase